MSIAMVEIVVTVNQQPGKPLIPLAVVEFPISEPVLITNESGAFLTNDAGVMLEKG